MHLGFLSEKERDDVTYWSGTPYHLFRALQVHDPAVRFIGPCSYADWRLRAFFWQNRIIRAFTGKTRIPQIHPPFMRHLSREAEPLIAAAGIDVLLSPLMEAAAYLKPGVRLVLWRDAPFAGLVDRYPYFSGLTPAAIRAGHAMEQTALDRASLVIFSSQWAADCALKHYRVDPAKLKVVCYGANLGCDRTAVDAERLVAQRRTDRCQLLFIGVEWERKGGDIALQVVSELAARGLDVHLHLVGAKPANAVSTPQLTFHGFINKADPQGQALFLRLFEESHFCLLPTRADCLGLAIAEASAYAMPSISNDVMGVGGVLRDGRNGRLLREAAEAKEYAQAIADLFRDQAAYKALSRLAFAEYQESLNWHAATAKALAIIRAELGALPSAGRPGA